VQTLLINFLLLCTLLTSLCRARLRFEEGEIFALFQWCLFVSIQRHAEEGLSWTSSSLALSLALIRPRAVIFILLQPRQPLFLARRQVPQSFSRETCPRPFHCGKTLLIPPTVYPAGLFLNHVATVCRGMSYFFMSGSIYVSHQKATDIALGT
jgi:hypothetical protein